MSAIIHVGDKTRIILAFYTEITVATTQIAAAFGNAYNAIQDAERDWKRYRGISVSFITISPLQI